MPWGEPTALPRGSALGGACHPQASGQVWLCQLNAKETGDGGSRVRALREKNSKTSKECVASLPRMNERRRRKELSILENAGWGSEGA